MSHSFVRTQMLPAQTPPVSERGAVKWIHENLFSGWLNSLLTVLSVGFVAWLVWTAFPWWWNGVWTAGSLSECREIVAAGGAKDGACWAVIRERWHQYIFGFYPQDSYWRPILTFGLLFVALAPILYWNDRKAANLTGIAGVLTVLWMLALSSPASADIAVALLMGALFALAWARPRMLLWATAAYPFAALFLLWGGQVWTYASAILAVAVAAVAGLAYARLGRSVANIVYAVFVALCAGVLAAVVIRYLDAVSTDFLTKLSGADFYPGFLSESGIVGRAFGAVVSALVWAVSMLVWGLIALLRAVSWALGLNLGQVSDLPHVGLVGIGSVLAAVGVFSAARSRTAGIGIFGGLAALAVYLAFAHPWLVGRLSETLPLGLRSVSSDEFGGFLLALVIGVTAITASLPLGILLALGRRSDMFLVKTLSVGFIEFIRGVPLITLLFTASLLLQYFLPPQTNFDLILRVIILASLFSAAYLAEVIRGGLAALPRGQYEAADALGLDYWQAQRLIVMPQALKISIPGIVSTFIGLFKDTTLVSFVGLLDPLRGVTQIVRADINWKGIYWEPYIFVGAIFFLICFSMSRYSMYLERKLKTDHR